MAWTTPRTWVDGDDASLLSEMTNINSGPLSPLRYGTGNYGRHAFTMFRSTAQTVTNGNWSTIQWNAIYQSGSFGVTPITATNVVTCAGGGNNYGQNLEPGVWCINTGYQAPTTVAQYQAFIGLLKNANYIELDQRVGKTATANIVFPNISSLVQLVASDALSVQVFQYATALTIANYYSPVFNGFWIRPN